ncbi:MAG: asparagine synthase (glutamine-hydrolyzing) [Acidobacteria bacterium]|nr:asparagine synthase (glutamine-hydrolyzing) [Acidobacteriota bacterium]
MCGIAGFVTKHPKLPDPFVLRRMMGAIRHRGPDESGVHSDLSASIGHVRLSIIDLAGGHQPMYNEDGSLVLSFNGEIFNYLELREELIQKGHRFATRSDSEVILHLFEEEGESCVNRLNGQWAFAIWDSRRRSLFLSRDRLGVRPLFYTWTGDAFVFASEIKALMEYPGVRRELDLRALDEVFTFWYTLPPRTAFRGIYEIPPGYSATLAAGELTLKQYWDIHYPPQEPAGDTVNINRYGEQLLELLEDATRIRLRADVPVGAYLSGGLDSTVIAALARRYAGRLETFSVRFEDRDLDEGGFQHNAVRFLGTNHQEILCSSEDIGRIFPEVIWHAEKPIVRTAPAPFYLLARLVRERGFKVVLTGEGSDEMLGGYDIFKEVQVRRFCAAHPESKLRPLMLRRLYPYLRGIQSQPAAWLNAFFKAGAGDVQAPFFSHLPRWQLTARLKAFFSDDVRAELGTHNAYLDLLELLPQTFPDWDPFTRAEYLEARYLLPGYILSSQGDRVAMAHAVEGRYPFLDYRFVEFANRLPRRLKMRVLKEKYLLKRCATHLAPPEVIERSKQPYRAPDARSFVGARPPGYVEELLSPSRLRRDGIFRPEPVQKLLAKARSGNLTGAGDNMAFVGVLSTELLIDRFLHHSSQEYDYDDCERTAVLYR